MDASKINSLRQQIESLSWYHTIDLGNGIVTPGAYDHRPYLHYYGLPTDLHGKTALDVGPASGYFTFELERRGAELTVVELPRWEDHDFGPRHESKTNFQNAESYLHEPFRVAAKALDSQATVKSLTIYQVTPETVGMFDLVFCGSVLLHLTDPIRALWGIQKVTRGAAIIATMIWPNQSDEPLAHFSGHDRGDCWWLPNRVGLEKMVYSAGFQDYEWWSDFRLDYASGQEGPYHGVIFAWNTPQRPDWLPSVEQRPITPPQPNRGVAGRLATGVRGMIQQLKR